MQVLQRFGADSDRQLATVNRFAQGKKISFEVADIIINKKGRVPLAFWHQRSVPDMQPARQNIAQDAIFRRCRL